MTLNELTRWLLLGLVTDEEIRKHWEYQPNMNFQKLTHYVHAAGEYAKGNSNREIDYLELRLPLVLRDKNVSVGEIHYRIEMDKIQNGKVLSTIKSSAMSLRPDDSYAERLSAHFGAQQFRITEIMPSN